MFVVNKNDFSAWKNSLPELEDPHNPLEEQPYGAGRTPQTPGSKTSRYGKNTSCCTFTLQMPDSKILKLKKNSDLAGREKRSATS